MGCLRATHVVGAAMALLSVGCRRCPELEEVPIEGGTTEQRGQVSNTLANLAQWLAPEPVCLSKVRFAPLKETANAEASYNVLSRQVRVAKELPTSRIPTAMIHEVCHAVDYQWNILQQHGDSFSFAEGRAFDDIDGRKLDREAIAHVCELGEPWLAALGEPQCEGETDWLWEPIDVVLQEVYQAVPAPMLGELHWMATTGPMAAVPSPDKISVDSHPEEGALVLYVVQEHVGYVLRVDAATGERPIEVSSMPYVPSERQGPSLGDLRVLEHVDVPQRPGEQVARVRAWMPRGSVERLLWITPESVRTLAVCIPPLSALAVTANDVVLASVEGDAVVWGRIALP